MKFLSTLIGASVASAFADAKFSALPQATRYLEDANGNSYAYLDDISNYSIQYSSCVRVKLPNEYDDDQAEGNVNYYNGRYHAQYKRYATFHLCRSDGMQCTCDDSVEYTTEMNQFLQNSLNYFDNYCANGNCKNYYSDDGDESEYLECAAGHQDEDGTQYYYAPQCDENSNGVVIGVFYDEECTIKTKNSAPDLKYYKFQTVVNNCVDCGEAGYCNDLYQEAYHCKNGAEASGKEDNELNVCSTVKKYLYNHDYSSVRTRKSGEKAFLKVFFSLLTLSVIGSALFLTYTYYIRHRNGGDALLTADQLQAAPESLT
ncbi:hypothetical protein ACHAXN_007997 [Cyclotella atomus]|jgi:hypothetical protein